MAHYFKAEYPGGQVLERWGMGMHGLKLNGIRPITISIVPWDARELKSASLSVHPGLGKVVELSSVPRKELPGVVAKEV
jgi:hypothetical protein